MQEHSNQVGKIIMIPQLTVEEQTLPKKDYFAQAEKIVTERRQREEAEKNSIMNKFRLPGAGDLVQDISPEERAREELERRKRELEEQQQRLWEQQQQLVQQPVTIPATATLVSTAQPTVQPVIQQQPVFATTTGMNDIRLMPHHISIYFEIPIAVPAPVVEVQRPEFELRTAGSTEPPVGKRIYKLSLYCKPNSRNFFLVYDSSTGRTILNQLQVERGVVASQVPLCSCS